MRSSLISGVAAAVLLLSNTLPCQANSDRVAGKYQIVRLIEEVEKGQLNSNARQAKATKLALLVHHEMQLRNGKAIDRQVISRLAGLLKFSDVREWSAFSLANIGPKAKSAAPLLNAALKDEMLSEQGLEIQPEHDAVGALCVALKNVSGEIPPPCSAR
jgi:hypothetical protein